MSEIDLMQKLIWLRLRLIQLRLSREVITCCFSCFDWSRAAGAVAPCYCWTPTPSGLLLGTKFFSPLWHTSWHRPCHPIKVSSRHNSDNYRMRKQIRNVCLVLFPAGFHSDTYTLLNGVLN